MVDNYADQITALGGKKPITGQEREKLFLESMERLSEPYTKKQRTEEVLDLKLTPEDMMKNAKYIYLTFEEIWTGLNVLATNVVKGFDIRADNPEEAEQAKQWCEKLGINEVKLKKLVLGAYINGAGMIEFTPELFLVRDKSEFVIGLTQQNEIERINQAGNTNGDLPVERFKFLILNSLFDGDVHGISAILPMFNTAYDMQRIREVNRIMNDIYRAPTWIIETPLNAPEEQRQQVAMTLKNRPPDADYVLPPGFKVVVINAGMQQFRGDKMFDEITARFWIGMKFPKQLLVPEGDTTQSRQNIDFIIANAIKPDQLPVKYFLEGLMQEALGLDVNVIFEQSSIFDAQQKSNLIATIQNLIIAQLNISLQLPEEPKCKIILDGLLTELHDVVQGGIS